MGNIQKDKDIEKSIISSGGFVIPDNNLTSNIFLQSHHINYFKGIANLVKNSNRSSFKKGLATLCFGQRVTDLGLFVHPSFFALRGNWISPLAVKVAKSPRLFSFFDPSSKKMA